MLVTGGAGYIGSHVVLALQDAGRPVVVVDDLSNGSKDLIPSGVPLIVGDVGDAALIGDALGDHRVSAVMHFAANISVAESMTTPLVYYRNNTVASRTLIDSCVKARIRDFVFSSTAAVYGMLDKVPVREDAPPRPINPYGRSKLMTEWMLADAASAHGLRYAALRYFNVAGADPRGRSGEYATHVGHLLKVAGEVAAGTRQFLEIFGEDYDTPDGTCIRDYIHVSDLADAHMLILDRLAGSEESLIVNCGYGHGFSVREVIRAVEKTLGRKVEWRGAPRRAGDPPILVADASRMRSFGWRPRFDDLSAIVQTAIDWELKRSSPQRAEG
ncbi:MAG: UDP-glucose 4-epimerase GalE [Alphaproteobacteria bacterium]|nr:UDP-glucose 4-epimerase GalE [Alphaproteobacteria bacterium]